MVKYKMDFKFKRVSLRKMVSFGVICFGFLLLAFMIFYSPGEVIGFNYALQKMVGYQKEAYYTVRIIDDFRWTIKYTFEGIYDTLTPFIPRFIWEDKPFTGFYHRYWRPLYEPNTVIYQTSTAGALAEAYMMFGIFGSFIYAFIFYKLCKWVYNFFQKTRSPLGLFVVCYLQCSMYFFVRFGILSSTIVNFVYQFVIAFILLNFLLRVFSTKKDLSQQTYITKKK
jgi:oligosaccharide repeat unit polymerase